MSYLFRSDSHCDKVRQSETLGVTENEAVSQCLCGMYAFLGVTCRTCADFSENCVLTFYSGEFSLSQ